MFRPYRCLTEGRAIVAPAAEALARRIVPAALGERRAAEAPAAVAAVVAAIVAWRDGEPCEVPQTWHFAHVVGACVAAVREYACGALRVMGEHDDADDLRDALRALLHGFEDAQGKPLPLPLPPLPPLP